MFLWVVETAASLRHFRNHTDTRSCASVMVRCFIDSGRLSELCNGHGVCHVVLSGILLLTSFSEGTQCSLTIRVL